MGKTFKSESHILVPKHAKLSENEAKKFLEKNKLSVKDLPKILKDDPSLSELGANPGDVIKVFRKSEIVGDMVYYRGVING